MMKLQEMFQTLEPISFGWSHDQKFRAIAEDGTPYFLRISDVQRAANRKQLFSLLKKVQSMGIPMCEPIDYGVCDEGCYLLQSWIDGDDAEASIPNLSEEDQYRLGRTAGEFLFRLHQIPAPDSLERWDLRYGRKIDRNLSWYESCPVHFAGDAAVITYLKKNRKLLENRPQCFQHGDYHIGNFMIRQGQLVVIDFDRYDFGDPWEEFNRISWCVEASPQFASGMVDGYFDGAVPDAFWRLLALYVGCNLLASFPWAIPYGKGEVQTMQRQAKEVLSWYHGFDGGVPAWYQTRKKRWW